MMSKRPSKYARLVHFLKAASAYIKANPHQFNMNYWECGTFMCIGGVMCKLVHREDPSLAPTCASDLYEDLGLNFNSPAAIRRLEQLFFSWPKGEHKNVALARKRIAAVVRRFSPRRK
jgi:hypothetical protein